MSIQNAIRRYNMGTPLEVSQDARSYPSKADGPLKSQP